jgi:Asp-tRNA(Asn)/Glu-tRNA(Gln) amidotransferase A subunit family amidase
MAADEPRLRATYAPDPEGARTAARESEKRWADGAPIGALDGVPVTIKENIATRGTPSPLGTGLKPTFGRVPVDPPYIGRVIGPMCRTAADASLLMSVIGVPDPRDHSALPAAEIDWPDSPGDVRGLRIGLLSSVGTALDTDPEIRAAVEAAARVFEAAAPSSPRRSRS